MPTLQRCHDVHDSLRPNGMPGALQLWHSDACRLPHDLQQARSMTDQTQQHVAALTQSITHHAGIVGKKYELQERIFHARQMKAKADEVLNVLLREESGIVEGVR